MKESKRCAHMETERIADAVSAVARLYEYNTVYVLYVASFAILFYFILYILYIFYIYVKTFFSRI